MIGVRFTYDGALHEIVGKRGGLGSSPASTRTGRPSRCPPRASPRSAAHAAYLARLHDELWPPPGGRRVTPEEIAEALSDGEAISRCARRPGRSGRVHRHLRLSADGRVGSGSDREGAEPGLQPPHQHQRRHRPRLPCAGSGRAPGRDREGHRRVRSGGRSLAGARRRDPRRVRAEFHGLDEGRQGRHRAGPRRGRQRRRRGSRGYYSPTAMMADACRRAGRPLTRSELAAAAGLEGQAADAAIERAKASGALTLDNGRGYRGRRDPASQAA